MSSEKTMSESSCEQCSYFVYDDDWECYVCDLNLDEDEMVRFMQGKTAQCPYFQLYDEYKIVRKQN